jgi:peptidoglycan/LPS O-acetylase OafA/YrhL
LREKAKTGRIDLTHFYLRRTLRIFPAAFFYVTVVALVAHPGYLTYAYTYTMCYAGQERPWLLGHLWSLSVEEQFYLLWPFAVAYAFPRRQKIGIAVMLAAPVARFIFWHFNLRDIDEYFPAVADSLMAGCMLAFSRDTLLRKFGFLRRTGVFLLLGALTLSIPFMLPRVRLEIILGGIPALIIALFLHSAIERKDWFLNNRFMFQAGLLSYSLYLWQQPFINRTHPAWWTRFPLNIVLATACATVSYYAVERPFLTMFRKKPELEASTGAAVVG